MEGLLFAGERTSDCPSASDAQRGECEQCCDPHRRERGRAPKRAPRRRQAFRCVNLDITPDERAKLARELPKQLRRLPPRVHWWIRHLLTLAPEPNRVRPRPAAKALSETRFTIAAYAIVENDRGELLLTRRRESDDWVLPGGSVEDEEAPWEAVVREVAEETGLKIALRRLIGVYAKRSEHDLVFLFAASPVGGELATSEERDRVAFLDPHQLPEQTSDRDRERIADAFADGQTPVLRVQPSEGDEPPDGTG